jgi:hypothetical protein
MGVLVCLRFAVISYTVTWQNKHEKTNIINQKKKNIWCKLPVSIENLRYKLTIEMYVIGFSKEF